MYVLTFLYEIFVFQQTLKSLKVRVSVIGLSAEVRVCTVLTRETCGSYHVILDESHFKELLMLHVKPPPASSSSECSLIRMGQCTLYSYYDTHITLRCLALSKNKTKMHDTCILILDTCIFVLFLLTAKHLGVMCVSCVWNCRFP